MSFSSRSLCRLGVVATVLLAQPQTSQAESWTDLSGTRTIEARLVGLWNQSVVLQMGDGRRVTVNLEDLQAGSRIQAQNMAREQKLARAERVKELQGQAADAAAPAPTPLPTPPPAPDYQPPTPNTPCVAQLQWMIDQSNAGHLRAQFDALPPSYRKDIGDLVQGAVAKVDPAAWQSITGSLHQIGDLVVTRQRWLFSHPRLEALNPTTREKIEEFLLTLGGLLREGLDPQALDPAQLQSVPFENWLAQRSDAMAPYLAEMTRIAGGSSLPSFQMVSEKDGVTTVKVTVDSTEITQTYTQVDGFWVQSELATNWPTMIADAKKSLEDTPNGSILSDGMAAMIPAMIGPMISPLASAKDKKEFQAAMEPIFAQVQPAVSSLTMLAGISPQRGRGGSQMDNEYGSMDDEYEREMQAQMESEEMEMGMEMDMDMEMEMEMRGDESQN
ncbi:MAG: hypothetical protein HKN47_03475 [Pirellulaceae bacterium]|nr:hypothetical protein [Pirellulaceae bacterium]